MSHGDNKGDDSEKFEISANRDGHGVLTLKHQLY